MSSASTAPDARRAALVTLARGTLDVSGPKRQDYLHAMLSNEVNALRPGEGRRAASMSAKGSFQALLRVLVDTSVVVLETEQEQARAGAAHARAPQGGGARALRARRDRRPRGLRASAAAVLARAGGRRCRAAGANEAHVEGRARRARRARSCARATCRAKASCCTRRWTRRRRRLPRSARRPPCRSGARRSTRCASRRSARGTGRDISEDNLLHETGLVARAALLDQGLLRRPGGGRPARGPRRQREQGAAPACASRRRPRRAPP